MSSGNGNHRLRRAERNEQAFQEHNERRAETAELGGVPEDVAVPFVCECSDAACARAISLSLDEYERAAGPEDQFVVIPGHEDLAVEEVVERHEAYLVVRKSELRRG